MRVYGSFLPARSLRRWYPSTRGPAVHFSGLLHAAAAAATSPPAAVRVLRREIKLRPHRRRRGAVRVRVWRGGEAVSAHGQNAADASHVRLQLQRHAALRPQAAARGPHQAGEVPRETRRLRDGPLHRRARDAAPALGARHRMCALQAARAHAPALQEAAERQRALPQQQLQVRALRENQGRVRHAATQAGEYAPRSSLIRPRRVSWWLCVKVGETGPVDGPYRDPCRDMCRFF